MNKEEIDYLIDRLQEVIHPSSNIDLEKRLLKLEEYNAWLHQRLEVLEEDKRGRDNTKEIGKAILGKR